MAGGFVLLGICLLAGHFIGGKSTSGLASAAKYFIPIWLVIAAINMWVGVVQAGYSVMDEAPIFLLIFALPAVVAFVVWWKLSHG